MKKALVHTLEALLATLILIGFIYIISPALPQENPMSYVVRNNVYSALDNLEKNQKLLRYAMDEDLGSLNSSLNNILPSWMQFSVALSNVNLSIPAKNNDYNFSIVDSSSVNYKEIKLDARIGSNFSNVIGDLIVWDNTGPLNVSQTSDLLNITTTANSSTSLNVSVTSSHQYKIKIKKFKRLATIPSNKDILVVSYIVPGHKTDLIPTEFIVYTWR